MAINSTPKEMPTGGGNPTAGAINGLNSPTGQSPRKDFETLRAAFALNDHTLHRSDPADGPVTSWAERWGLWRYLLTLHDLALFLARIGGRV